MCQKCVDLLNEILPADMPWDDKVDVLWNHTAYPSAQPETIEGQLREYRESND